MPLPAAEYRRLASQPTNNFVGDAMAQGAVDLVVADLNDMTVGDSLPWQPPGAAGAQPDAAAAAGYYLAQQQALDNDAGNISSGTEICKRKEALADLVVALAALPQDDAVMSPEQRLAKTRKLLRQYKRGA